MWCQTDNEKKMLIWPITKICSSLEQIGILLLIFTFHHCWQPDLATVIVGTAWFIPRDKKKTFGLTKWRDKGCCGCCSSRADTTTAWWPNGSDIDYVVGSPLADGSNNTDRSMQRGGRRRKSVVRNGPCWAETAKSTLRGIFREVKEEDMTMRCGKLLLIYLWHVG